MNALRRIHAALVRDGFLVDTQPVSGRPPVLAGSRRLGTLDMREWLKTIEAVDELVAMAIDDALYMIEDEHRFLVADRWEGGPELVETVSGWQGTRIRARSATGWWRAVRRCACVKRWGFAYCGR